MRNMHIQKIGKKIKNLRHYNNLTINNTLKKLKELNINVSKKTFYKWENDEIIPDLETIKVLSYIYNANISELYEDTKYYKSLTENEFKFISMLRENNDFRKLTKLLTKVLMEVKWNQHYLLD